MKLLRKFFNSKKPKKDQNFELKMSAKRTLRSDGKLTSLELG